jgi:hypothetical protein
LGREGEGEDGEGKEWVLVEVEAEVDKRHTWDPLMEMEREANSDELPEVSETTGDILDPNLEEWTDLKQEPGNLVSWEDFLLGGPSSLPGEGHWGGGRGGQQGSRREGTERALPVDPRSEEEWATLALALQSAPPPPPSFSLYLPTPSNIFNKLRSVSVPPRVTK